MYYKIFVFDTEHLVTFSLGSTLLGVVYKPAVLSGECAGVFVFLYHIHVVVGRVGKEGRLLLLFSLTTLPSCTVCSL